MQPPAPLELINQGDAVALENFSRSSGNHVIHEMAAEFLHLYNLATFDSYHVYKVAAHDPFYTVLTHQEKLNLRANPSQLESFNEGNYIKPFMSSINPTFYPFKNKWGFLIVIWQ